MFLAKSFIRRGLLHLILRPISLRIPKALLVGALYQGAVHETNAFNVLCTDTWFQRGVENRLVLDWNSPLPVMSDDAQIGMPPPGPESSEPPTVVLSKTEISENFSGFIDLTISQLNPDQRVILEKYLVDGPEGEVEPDSLLQASYVLQDGFSPMVGEVFNFNVPNDLSDVPGEVSVQLDFYEPGIGSIVGDYVYRVRSPQDKYVPVDVRLRVTSDPEEQKFFGIVSNDGDPVSDVFVALLDPLSQDNDFIRGTTTDENGRYELFADWDEYDLVAVAPGYVGAYGKGVGRYLSEGETVEANLTVLEGDRTISGVLEDSQDAQIRLPGVEMLFFLLDEMDRFDSGLFTVAWTNHQGEFSARVTEGRWGVIPRHQAIYDLGYQNAGLTFSKIIDARNGNSGDHRIRLTRGRSMIWGTLTSSIPDETGNYPPLCGVEIQATRSDGLATAHGVTDGDGDYRLAVSEGYWNVAANHYSLLDLEHTGSLPSDIKIGAESMSINYDFSARPVEAWVSGFATDEDDEPLARLEVRAIPSGPELRELVFQSTYETDGFFEFGLASGSWNIFPEPLVSAHRQLIFVDLPSFTVQALDEGEEAVEIDASIETVLSTSTLTVSLAGSTSDTLSGIRAHAYATLDGSEYHSFGVSDSEGVIRIATIDGPWSVHISDRNLRERGFLEEPSLEVMVTGETGAEISIRRFENRPTRLSHVASSANEPPLFLGQGEAGKGYLIEGSTDLHRWRELGRVIAEEGEFSILDQTHQRLPNLFLRARSQ